MKLLVLNSGSSSIKFKLFEMDRKKVLASGICEKIGEENGSVEVGYNDTQTLKHTVAIKDHSAGFILMQELLGSLGIIDDFRKLDSIGHRVVHGGEYFHKAAVIDANVISQIEKLSSLAPLHNPSNLTGIEIMRRLAPNVAQVAVFDTAFHQSMDEPAYLYALPYTLYEKEHIRRYGFHGTSHHYVAKTAAAYLKHPLEELNLITLHLGNGVSATAIKNGKSIDTSMGMTPLEGLMMGTRCGDIDPAIILYMIKNMMMSADEIDTLLNKQSGLKGICGVNDMREILALSAAGDKKAALALTMFTRRLKKQIGAYTALLGRVDAVIFTGGIGEHAPAVRKDTCAGLAEGLGIIMDNEKNLATGADIAEISSSESRVKILVVPTDEELEIARQTKELVVHC